jgi:hypothetical protein
MTAPDFLALLLAALAKIIPGYAEMTDVDCEANLALARSMFEAFQPADALEAVQAANAVAAGLAAMDSFTRAARPGLSDQTVTRLRSSALAAGRVFDVAVRARGGEQPPARTRPQSSRAAASRTPAVPTSQARHRAELPLPIPGLADAAVPASRRQVWSGTTALTPLQPTVLPPD